VKKSFEQKPRLPKRGGRQKSGRKIIPVLCSSQDKENENLVLTLKRTGSHLGTGEAKNQKGKEERCISTGRTRKKMEEGITKPKQRKGRETHKRRVFWRRLWGKKGVEGSGEQPQSQGSS